MNPHNLQTSVVALILALTSACGAATTADDGRDESFLALMGSDGKADSLYVAEHSAEARAVLAVVNTASFRELNDLAALDHRAAANILSHRQGNPQNAADDNPFDTLVELDATPWVGLDAFLKLRSHARAHGYLEAAVRPSSCTVDADCGVGVCHVDRCFDRTEVDLDVSGDMTFDVEAGGEWWVRAYSGGLTVREARGRQSVDEVSTSTYDAPEVRSWLARLPDGSLTAVTQSGREVMAEFAPPMRLGPNMQALDAAYNAAGDLFVAAEARDNNGIAQGLVVYRYGGDGWREELKHSFDGHRDESEHQKSRFVRGRDGDLQIWADIDANARRFDRSADGSWRAAMVLAMEEQGFGALSSDRKVDFLQASDGTVFVHRSTWNFSRKHQVVRIEGNVVTAVIDMPSTVRHVAPLVDGDFTVVYSDGTLGRIVNSAEVRGTAQLQSPPDSNTIVRANGDDLYVLQGPRLTVLTARELR